MIFAAMPHYGQIYPDSARSLFFGASEHLYRPAMAGTSLLAHTFNSLWVEALNQRQSLGITHFAMIHADVDAPTFWIDTLIAELESSGADLVSAVIPIKSNHGRTSTAIDTDPWKPRRLTMREVMELSETFGSVPGVPGDLLVNTGLWVCRFDETWVEKVHFEINDRIVRLPDGRFEQQTQPEDWSFSRQLHALGRKVVATRKVKVGHIGPARYENHHAWGTLRVDE